MKKLIYLALVGCLVMCMTNCSAQQKEPHKEAVNSLSKEKHIKLECNNDKSCSFIVNYYKDDDGVLLSYYLKFNDDLGLQVDSGFNAEMMFGNNWEKKYITEVFTNVMDKTSYQLVPNNDYAIAESLFENDVMAVLFNGKAYIFNIGNIKE